MCSCGCPGFRKYAQQSAHAFKVRRNKGRAGRARAHVHRPCPVGHPLEQVLVSAIVADGEQEIRVRLGLLEACEGPTLISPHRLDLEDICSAGSPELRFGKHGFQHRDQFVCQPHAELGLCQPVVPHQ